MPPITSNWWRLVAAMLVGLAAATPDDVDVRVCAIRSKTLEELLDICSKASIQVADGADLETVRAAVYVKMQGEIAGAAVKEWPGPGTPEECADKLRKQAADRVPQGAPDLAVVAKNLFSKLDADHDGKLVRAEMQSMIDSVNAQARAQGVPEHDLFATLDQDKDGVVSRSEADETLRSMAAAQLQSKAAASKQGGKAQGSGKKSGDSDDAAMIAGLFRSLDVDKDDKLSRAEMASVLAQYEADAKAKGETVEDFWSSLDQDGDGFVSQTEAEVVIGALVKQMMDKKSKDEL